MSLNQRRAVLDAIPAGGSALEWGSGGTTLWLLSEVKPDQRLVSVEHDPGYSGIVAQACGKYSNWKMIERRGTIEPGRNATPYEECPAGFADYVCPVTPDELKRFDVFLIDGIARGACLANVLLNGTPGARVFLHDIQRDDWYAWAIRAGAARLADPKVIEPDPGDYPSLMWRAVLR